jgi:outer membrane protein OmpA-like peptidoglycan-associated protein
VKNFVFASIVFLIWALFGAWLHAYTHPKEPVLIQPEVTIKPKPVIIKNTVIPKPTKKDSTVSKTDSYKFPKKIIYLNFNQKTFNENEVVDIYVKNLKAFLDKVETAQIYIVGYTDNIGDSISNYWVGFERAKNFKSFLISQGIDKQIIHTSSKGEKEPLAKNNSKKERRKNRRIEITVKTELP